ncbi:cellulose binding domain-containing protein [Hymenobacter sp. UV11]|uniref:glucuronyl esterase domain-containing protein n=1 Tax=Hymenobacter sp. UV11 TaxID=1849735 RepID=UPI0010E7E8FB|nr:cellulose binding domain-containing protein [Hymenobacter sp. UV11]TDN38862.1 hypothetical protein A8B98_22130 [Hymenobacter sp. UV11]
MSFSCLSLFAQAPLVYTAENTGGSCAAPPLPAFSQLPAIQPLPDPFLWANGSGRSTSFSDWECRRNEIKAQIENYEIGKKPARPQNITASYANGTLTVNVTVNGKTATLTSQVVLPAGAGPFPAIIGMNSPTGSVPASVFTGRNVATIRYNHNNVTTYGNPQLTDPFYQLYPDQNLSNSGQYAAWAWGVSRLIDGLELVQASLPIDLKHLGVTGCSYAGKMALFAGAFDERIALTIAQESGGGGAPAWRVSETLGAVEKLGATDYSWFKDDMKQFADANVSKLPEDHHELMAMVAPRALLVTGNTDFEWLANPAAYVSARATHEVYKTFGLGDRFGFYIDGGHNHCAVPTTQVPAMQAFVDKFLLGNTSVNTNITTNPYPTLDYQRWYKWWGTNNPVLPPLPPEPLGKRIWLEAECATVGSSWSVVADTAAAAGAYVKVKSGLSSTATPPSGAAAVLTTPFTIDSAGTYNVLARLNIPPTEDYSYWVQLDNGAFQAVGSQLATNPSFESGLTGWTTLNSSGATITANNVAADAHTGTGSLKVVNPTAQPGSQWRVQVSSAAFPTAIGKQYVISYWVRAAAAGGSIRLSSGPSSAQYQADQAIGTAWQQVSWTITASLTSTTFLFDMGQVANTYYIDDASIKEVGATAGWRWIKLKDAALSPGPHTLTIGYNAGGNAGLDKLLVTSSNLPITGKGLAADNCKTSQTISFAALPPKLYGDADFALTATASSGLPITFISSDPTVATVTNGMVQLLKAGTTTITALQAGNAVNQPAAVNQTLTVAPVLVQVQYKDDDNSRPTGQDIKPTLRLDNQGPTAVDYGSLTARYWLTPENYSGLATSIDYAALGTSQVHARYVPLAQPRQGALGYVEYTFDTNLGNLAAGGTSGEIRSRFNNLAYGDLNETDDYSYRPNAGAYALNDHITLYRNGRLVYGTEPTTVVPTTSLEVLAQNRNGYSRGNTISEYLNVRNTGNQPVNYADLKVRYWFSPEGAASLNYWFDWAQVGTSNVSGQVGQKGAEFYFETSFSPSLGQLAPLSSTGDVRFRLAKSDWSNFMEDNDWSYRAPWNYALNDHVTAYYQGQLVYGIEPGAASAAARTVGAATTLATTPATSQDALLEAYPNPVASATTVQFRAAQAGRALVQVFNPLGQLVATLYDGTVEDGRTYQLPFAAQSLANGLYECRLLTVGKTLTQRVAVNH